VLEKGIIVAPPTARSLGPCLDATRTTALQRVANRPIVCHVLDAMRDAGVVEVALVVPSEAADELVACIANEAPTGVEVHPLVCERGGERGDAMGAALELVGEDPCILHRADGLLGQPLLPFIELLREDALDLLLARQAERDAKHLRLVAGWADGAADLAGLCVLGRGALRRVRDVEWPATGLDFAVLAEQMSRRGGRVEVGAVRGWRHFEGDTLDLLDMNRMLLDALEPESTPIDDDGNRFEGRVVIHPTARVMSSVIVGPVIVGADAVIADAYVGPHTAIGERVRIQGAEIERSIVLADASILHIGGRLVASVVGRDVRIFRDFSVPRAMRLQVADGDEVALC